MIAPTRLHRAVADQRPDAALTIDRFSAGMAETLGVKALQVAIGQMEIASGEALATWSEIVERLGRRSPISA